MKLLKRFSIRFPPPPEAVYDPVEDCWYTPNGESWGKPVPIIPLFLGCALVEGLICLVAYWIFFR